MNKLELLQRWKESSEIDNNSPYWRGRSFALFHCILNMVEAWNEASPHSFFEFYNHANQDVKTPMGSYLDLALLTQLNMQLSLPEIDAYLHTLPGFEENKIHQTNNVYEQHGYISMSVLSHDKIFLLDLWLKQIIEKNVKNTLNRKIPDSVINQDNRGFLKSRI